MKVPFLSYIIGVLKEKAHSASNYLKSRRAKPEYHIGLNYRSEAENADGMNQSLRILVTGCSSGFGEIIAKTLSKAGHWIFASMRDINERNREAAIGLRNWANLEGVVLNVVELDVANQKSVIDAVTSIEENYGGIDVVINNAGWGGMGIVEAFSIEQMQAMFDVNTMGQMRVNKAVLPAMRRRRSGLIVHVSSTAGRIVIPMGNPYSATKFALEALAESMHHQLAPFSIDVVILEPGYYPTTGFDQKQISASDAGIVDEYKSIEKERVGNGTREKTHSGSKGSADPQEVADVLLRLIAMPSGKRPLRTVVGTVASAGVVQLNAAYDKCKKRMLDSLRL